jgi:hypothetical protein
VSIPASKKSQAQLTFSIIFLKESLLSIFTRGSNSGGSADLSDGTTAKMKISALRVNIVGLWDERFIPLGLYMWLVPVVSQVSESTS